MGRSCGPTKYRRSGAPGKLNSNGEFHDVHSRKANFCFRIPSGQQDKIRAIDDFKQAEINNFCFIDTPISLPSWDHIARIFIDLGNRSTQWDFGKSDHAHAYKNSPLRPSGAELAYLVLFNPIDKEWYDWRPSALLFGSTAAVLHYNTCSRLFGR